MVQEIHNRRAIFVDDGAPDAVEFASNYIWFDADDPKDRERAWKEAEALFHARLGRIESASWAHLRPPRLSDLSEQTSLAG